MSLIRNYALAGFAAAALTLGAVGTASAQHDGHWGGHGGHWASAGDEI